MINAAPTPPVAHPMQFMRQPGVNLMWARLRSRPRPTAAHPTPNQRAFPAGGGRGAFVLSVEQHLQMRRLP